MSWCLFEGQRTSLLVLSFPVFFSGLWDLAGVVRLEANALPTCWASCCPSLRNLILNVGLCHHKRPLASLWLHTCYESWHIVFLFSFVSNEIFKFSFYFFFDSLESCLFSFYFWNYIWFPETGKFLKFLLLLISSFTQLWSEKIVFAFWFSDAWNFVSPPPFTFFLVCFMDWIRVLCYTHTAYYWATPLVILKNFSLCLFFSQFHSHILSARRWKETEKSHKGFYSQSVSLKIKWVSTIHWTTLSLL